MRPLPAGSCVCVCMAEGVAIVNCGFWDGAAVAGGEGSTFSTADMTTSDASVACPRLGKYGFRGGATVIGREGLVKV